VTPNINIKKLPPFSGTKRRTSNHAAVSHFSFGVDLQPQISKGINGLSFRAERKYEQFYTAPAGSGGNKQEVNW
jgi:hypothetical protein